MGSYEGDYLVAAIEAALANSTIKEELYPHGWKNMTTNVTAFISEDVGDIYHDCVTMGWDWYEWGIEYYDSFLGNDTQGWPISALQNLLENVIQIAQINQALVSTSEAKDFINFAFLMGRLMRVTLMVKPMAVETFETEFLAKVLIPDRK